MPEDDEKIYVELVRRLCAAYLSFQMTNKSVDYTLKRYVKRNPGRFWFQLARHVAETVPNATVNMRLQKQEDDFPDPQGNA
jgi:hypothetical protein